MSKYETFDTSRLRLLSLATRGHVLTADMCEDLNPPSKPNVQIAIKHLVERIRLANSDGKPVVLMMGAHPIKLGLSRYLIDLMDRRIITHVATNGAGLIHDFELALVGGTSENVAKWIECGQFGLWCETAELNEIVQAAARNGEGIGEAVGRVIESHRFEYAHLSVAAAGWRNCIPVTCHVSIGSDINHCYDNFDARATGEATYTDFLIFARTIQKLDGGVFLNVGSAVTGPEVFLKALSMARNVAKIDGDQIRRFTTAVFDLVELPDNFGKGLPNSNDPRYYFRPWKTLLVRTVTGEGKGYYIAGDHRQSIPTLWHLLTSDIQINDYE